MKLNIQLECNCTKENVTDIFKILDEEVQPFSLAISKMHGNKCSCTLKCELKNMKWKSHTNLTHPGKYFRPSKVKIMRPTSPK